MTRPDIDCDFLVVGSGAGGSVVAYHLARAGERVVMLERGRDVAPDAMNFDELEMIGSLYKEGGAQTNTDADMFVLQGNCVGGSTVLTNGVCFRLPDDVRRDFASRGFDPGTETLASAYDRVEDVLNVGPVPEHVMNPGTEPIARGMRSLGLDPGGFRKSMLRCIGCGYCNVGCAFGRKMDAARTFVPMARARGCELVTRAEARRIVTRRRGGTRVVERVDCRDLRDGSRFAIRARRVVLAGGAINTPELLLRSGIATDRVGRRTSFNAGAIVFAEFDEPIDGHRGDQMCVHHLTTRYAIEQIHNPPASFAATMPGWFDEHHARMQRYRYMTAAGCIVPTRPAGRVFLGLGHRLARRFFDHADLRFALDEHDLEALRDGLEQTVRIFLAAGARRVLPPTAEAIEIRDERDLPRLRAALRRQKDIVGFGSSHPQGGCALGDDPRHDVVTPDYRVRGVEDLFVADASLFPTSIRVNPMLTIMAVADHAVGSILGAAPAGPIAEGPVWEARKRTG